LQRTVALSVQPGIAPKRSLCHLTALRNASALQNHFYGRMHPLGSKKPTIRRRIERYQCRKIGLELRYKPSQLKAPQPLPQPETSPEPPCTYWYGASVHRILPHTHIFRAFPLPSVCPTLDGASGCYRISICQAQLMTADCSFVSYKISSYSPDILHSLRSKALVFLSQMLM
jgi:hypothetical protein